MLKITDKFLPNDQLPLQLVKVQLWSKIYTVVQMHSLKVLI